VSDSLSTTKSPYPVSSSTTGGPCSCQTVRRRTEPAMPSFALLVLRPFALLFSRRPRRLPQCLDFCLAFRYRHLPTLTTDYRVTPCYRQLAQCYMRHYHQPFKAIINRSSTCSASLLRLPARSGSQASLPQKLRAQFIWDCTAIYYERVQESGITYQRPGSEDNLKARQKGLMKKCLRQDPHGKDKGRMNQRG